jgi:hypothetical protein
MLKNCLYSTIAPQALEANERNTYGSFRGTAGVQNTNVDAKVNRLWNYPITNGLTLPNTTCPNGAVNVDNTCTCPGSMNSTPWQVSPLQPLVNKMLFEPFVEGAIAPLSPAAMKLIAQRRPLPQYLAGGSSLDGSLTCNHTEVQQIAADAEMRRRTGNGGAMRLPIADRG